MAGEIVALPERRRASDGEGAVTGHPVACSRVTAGSRDSRRHAGHIRP